MAVPSYPLRRRWWALALAIGVTLLGLHLAGSVYLLGPDYGWEGGWLGVFPYPDAVLVALLWAGFAGPPFWSLTGLALAIGGWGWGGERLGGSAGRLAGAMLVPAIALAPMLGLPLLLGVTPWGIHGLWPGAELMSGDIVNPPLGWEGAAGWAWVAPVLGVAAAAGLSPVGRRRRDLALYAGAVLATAMAATWSLSALLTTFSTTLLPGHPNLWPAPALFLVALLPVATLAALSPRRRRAWALLGLVGGLPLAAAAGTIPALVPGVATVASDHDWDPAADPGDYPEDRVWFATVGSVSPGKMDNAYLARSEEGYARRLVFPEAGLAFGHHSKWPGLRGLVNDRADLPAGRDALRRLTAMPGAKESAAFLYLSSLSHEPAITGEELEFVAALGEMFGHSPSVGAGAAAILYGRGRAEDADRVAAATMSRMGRISRLLRSVGKCPEAGCGSTILEMGDAAFRPVVVLAGPVLGQITVRLALGRVPGAESDLYVAVLPVGNGDVKTLFGWSSGSEYVTMAPVAGGKAVFGSLPAGRYGLQFGYREGAEGAFRDLTVSGWPDSLVEIGPGEWEKEIFLSVWPDDPLEAWCEDGYLEWAPLPLAGSYLVEGWSGTQNGVRRERSVAATGPHLPLEEVVGGQDWPTAGFRVVALDDFGVETARFGSLTSAGLWRGEDEAACERLAGDDRVGG